MATLDRPLIATAVQYAEPAPTLWSAPPDDAQHICRFTVGPGQQTWSGDEDIDPAAQLPAGAVWIDAPLAEKGIPSSVSMSPGLTTGEANISRATYKFLDDKGELDAWFQGKAANGLQLFGGTIEHFIIERGDVLETEEDLNRALWYTWQVKGTIALDHRVYSVKCEDVNRDAEREVFTARSHTLMSAISAVNSAAVAKIQIYLTDAEAQDLGTASWLFEHGPDYHVHPGETRAIGLLKDSDGHEYISWSGVSDSGQIVTLPEGGSAKKYNLENPRRGLFGTLPREWAFDASKPLSSRRKLVAVPYAEEHPLSLALAIYTGRTLDNRAFPWGLNIDQKWINKASLSAASMESYHNRLTIRSPKKAIAKRFVEEHCLARRGMFVINPSGAWSYVPAPIGTGTPTISLSEENCYGADSSDLVHDETDAATATVIEWDRDPITGDFRKVTEFNEPASLGETSATEPEIVEAPYLTTNRATEGEVLGHGRVLHARHARPVKRITLKPDWSMAHYSPGVIAQVDLPIKDYAAGGPTVGYISMPMMIASIRRDHHSEKLVWTMIGFRPLPGSMTGQAIEQLPESEYIANGIPIIASNDVASIYQAIHLTRKYYHLGDLLLPDGWPGSTIGRGAIELWVRGVLLWGSNVVLDGLGGLGGQGSVDTGSAGEQGAIPAPTPSGSVSVTATRFENSSGDPQAITRRRISSRPPSSRPSRPQVINQWTVTVERGRLAGLPSNTSGSGGAGGDGSTYRGRTEDGDVVAGDSSVVAGSDAGNGAASVKIVCSAGSGFVGNGAIRCNGDDGQAAASALSVLGAAGAGGAHGRVDVFHDTSGTPWQFDSTRLEARNGRAILAGTRAQTPIATVGSGSLMRSFYQPPNYEISGNNWQNAHSVQFLPTSDNPEDADSGSLFDEFFRNQLDRTVNLIVGNVDPGDGNMGDMLITQAHLDSNAAGVPFRIFTPDQGWRDFVRGVDDHEELYDFLILTNRQFDSLGMISLETRPIGRPGYLWHNELTGAIYLLLVDGPPDQLVYADSGRVGDNRFTDPEFTEFGLRGNTWFCRTGFDIKPKFDAVSGGSTNSGGNFPLDPPQSISVSPYDGSNEVLFGTPGSLDGLSGFEIRRDGSLIATITTAGPFSYLDTAIQPSTYYVYAVRSINGNQRSDDVTITIRSNAFGGGSTSLNSPTNLSGTVYSSTSLELSWTPTTSPEASSHQIRRDGVLVGTKDQNSGSHYESGLSPGTQYVYTVRAIAPNGDQSADASVTLTTNA